MYASICVQRERERYDYCIGILHKFFTTVALLGLMQVYVLAK